MKTNLRIVLYFINWNDSFYLPFIKEHYGKFCEKIVMYDNFSSDGSYGIAKQLGFEVRTFGTRGQLNDQDYLNVKNHCWKECRGKGIEYVIVCDADEFLTLPWKLTCSAPRVIGFNMISDKLPIRNIEDEISTGLSSEDYSKQIIFSPDRITEINYVHGCHRNNKIGDISQHDVCKMYHYRMIGGIDRILERHAEYRKRMSDFNKKHNMGFHYLHDDNAKRNEWNDLQSKAVQLW